MKYNLKTILFFLLMSSAVILVSSPVAQAVCPVCTIAVCSAVGLSRWLKIDDSITGLWIGGLTVSLIVWTVTWLRKKNWRFPGMPIAVALIYYLTVCLTLYFAKFLGQPANCFWGVDKLLWGIMIGSIFFSAGAYFYSYLKKKNGGKAYFPFQKVVMPIIPLLILSVIFYLLTKK
ncbi:MAG: hypothetical protein WC650_03765 [Candidatus Doudnabacteria bacterium]